LLRFWSELLHALLINYHQSLAYYNPSCH
jgi:hypothetical protein